MCVLAGQRRRLLADQGQEEKVRDAVGACPAPGVLPHGAPWTGGRETDNELQTEGLGTACIHFTDV